jgi:hypothetical protein
MYDKSGGGKLARQHIIVTLPWWHSYKMACNLVWRRFSNSFLAGSWHALYPNDTFSQKPHYLTSVVSHLSMIRMSYHNFKHALDQAMDSGTLPEKSLVYLTNLRSLCEFFIPVVSYINQFLIHYHAIYVKFISRFYIIVC